VSGFDAIAGVLKPFIENGSKLLDANSLEADAKSLDSSSLEATSTLKANLEAGRTSSAGRYWALFTARFGLTAMLIIGGLFIADKWVTAASIAAKQGEADRQETNRKIQDLQTGLAAANDQYAKDSAEKSSALNALNARNADLQQKNAKLETQVQELASSAKAGFAAVRKETKRMPGEFAKALTTANAAAPSIPSYGPEADKPKFPLDVIPDLVEGQRKTCLVKSTAEGLVCEIE
jgi:hypothetical protein